MIQESKWCHLSQPVAETVVTSKWQSAENQALLKRVEDRKNRSLRIAEELASRSFRREFERLAGCGSWVVIRNYFGGERSTATVAAADWCNQFRLCEPCAAARSVKLLRSVMPKILARIAAGELPVMFTLTVRDGPDLKERLQHLLKSMGKARQRRKNCQRRNRASFFALVTGLVFAVEIKRGRKSKQWHPHLHGIAMLPPGFEIDPEALTAGLSAEWHKITGDSHVVDVRSLECCQELENEVAAIDIAEQLGTDCQEVFKYAVKFGDMTPADVVEAWKASQGEKLVRRWGSLRGPVDESNDDLQPLTPEWAEHFLTWEAGGPAAGRYVRQRSSLDSTALDRPPGGRIVWEASSDSRADW